MKAQVCCALSSAKRPATARDASLYQFAGHRGQFVVDVEIFLPRKGGSKDERHKAIEASQVALAWSAPLVDEIRILTDERLKCSPRCLPLEQKLVADLARREDQQAPAPPGGKRVLPRATLSKISPRAT